jgi:hypothetical protein
MTTTNITRFNEIEFSIEIEMASGSKSKNEMPNNAPAAKAKKNLISNRLCRRVKMPPPIVEKNVITTKTMPNGSAKGFLTATGYRRLQKNVMLSCAEESTINYPLLKEDYQPVWIRLESSNFDSLSRAMLSVWVSVG